ncbi:MAG: gliding motility-associated C-terminal domain-containing protein [Ferruginibacter sp.]
MKRILLLPIFICAFFSSKSQNLSYSCPRDTILGCNTACFTLKAQFPDIRNVGDNYTLQDVSSQSACRPYVDPAGPGPSTNLDDDDYYSDVIPIGFTFPFYGVNQTSLVVSTNGVICFDLTRALQSTYYGILNGGGFLTATAGNPGQDLPSTLYDKSIIMGPYHDIYPGPLTIANSPNQKIKYNVIGTAPNRKWILSFYKIPLFDCTSLIENTHQIVLHESTGVIEVQIFDKEICTTWNDGRAMIGLQDVTRTKFIMAPGRKASDAPWGTIGMNEVWRFIPTGGAPLYRSVELLDNTGAVVATGDTTRININTFETTFSNVCPPSGNSFYVVKTTYQKLNDPTATIFSLDTINVVRQAALPVTATMTATTCGASTGTVTVTASGTPPYQYSIDGGPLQSSPVFTNLPAGPHPVHAVDATGCFNDITITVTSISALPSTYVSTNTSCTGVNNGSITVTPTAGATPYLFSIDGGVTTQPSGTFSNLAPGTYTVTFTDANLCAGTTVAITITSGGTITSSEAHTATSCAGQNDGTITMTPTVAGSYSFTLTPGTVTNTTGIFTGLASGSYTVTFTNTVTNCVGTNTITIPVGGSIPATFCHTASVCPGSGHDETCPGANDGAMIITPSISNTYTFTITPAPGVGPASNSTGIFQGLAPYPTTYTITFVNAAGCGGSVAGAFVLAASAISAGQAHTNATCPGVNDGTITVTPSPTGTYTYTLTPGPVTNTTGVFTGLAANTYSVSYTNVGGCGGTVNNIAVTTGAGATATAVAVNTSCPGASDGTITITPPATGAPFVYTLNPGAVVQNNNPVFTGLATNTYTITFTTATGCSGTVPVNPVVGSGAAPTTTAVAVNETCPGAGNGTVTITPPATGGPFIYTLNPGNVVQNNNPVFTGLATGTYTITFTTATGCSGTVPVNPVVASGAAPTATAAVVNATCPGVDNGTITITPPATGAPFIYTLNPGAIVQNNNPVFTGLAPGTYTITFTNSFTCSGTVPVNPVVGVGAAPTATALAANATCPGVDDGTITITPPATGGPFIYTLNPGNVIQNNNPVFTGLATGTYTITFTNAAGCSGTVPVNPVVGAGSTPTATAVAVSATCPGVDNGTITVTPPATGGPFIYTLNPGNIVQNNNPVFTGLATGTYTISFSTAIGCVGNVVPDPVVGAGSVPTATAVAVSATCPGVNDGTITVTPPATGGPFIYTLNPGNIVQNNNPVFTGLATGTYTISFSTSIGCVGNVIPDPFVGAGSVPTATAVAVSATCPGVDNGTITVTPPATGGPFIYTLNPGNIVQNNNPVFTGLATGTYTITFTTSIGCVGNVTPDPVVGAGTNPTTTAVAVNTTCPGVNDGTVTVTPPVSGGPFTYTLNPGAITNSTGIFTGLAPNTYTITFTTAIGCNGTVPVNPVVGTGAAPTATAVVANTTCPGVTDGTITINPPATGAPFVYTLNPGNIVQNNNPVFIGLAPNTYTITFTTALGCSGTVPVNPVVQAGPPLTANTPTITNPPCAFINDGILTIVPSLAGNYVYVLNPGTPTQVTQVNDPTFTGLAPGTYSYNFTNASGCVGTGTATLTTHAPLALSVTKTMPLCNGNANGIITLSASGGLATYQYALSPFTTYQAGTFNGLTAGTYTFRVKDAAGCTKDTTVSLAEPTLLTATAATTAGTCNGNDGQIIVAGHDGTPAYTFSIDGITYQSSQNFTVSGASGPGAGYSNITVMDNNGCTATAPVVYVTLVDNMSPLYIGNDTTICAEQHVTFQPQADPLANTFTWSTIPDASQISTLDDSNIKNATAAPLDTTTYVLIAAYGVCTRTDTIKINLLHKPVPDAGQDIIVCNDKTAYVTLQGNATNLSGTVNYEWSDTAHLETPHSATTVAGVHGTEAFTLTVTDNYGCNFSETDVMHVIMQPPVPAFAGNDTTAVVGQPHQLFATGGVSYEWTPTAPLNLSNVQNPLAVLDHDQMFQVTVTDIAGCIGHASVYVQVYPDGYHVPNAFSPNGDGLNDIFRVVPAGIAYTESFRIFNRYGQLVFETNKWMKGWDGTFQGKKQPMGNYVWVLKGVDKNGRVREMKGTVLLVQ